MSTHTAVSETRTQAVLDRITRLAGEKLGVPVACASFVNARRKLVASSAGLSTAVALLIGHRFSKRVVSSGHVLAIEDVRAHAMAIGRPAIDGMVLAFAGAPLVDSRGRAVGALFVMDVTPRSWTELQLQLLAECSALIASEMEADNGATAVGVM